LASLAPRARHTHPPNQPLPLPLQTLALHLIEGVIDQVDGSVQVSWVQPRILTLPQVRAWVNIPRWVSGLVWGFVWALRGPERCWQQACMLLPALARLGNRLPALPTVPPSPPQIEGLRTRLDGWVEKVSSAALTLEDEAVGVMAPAS
jgi:hypothetical protein